MGVYKRKAGGPWWVRFRIGGKEVDRSAHTFNKKDAEEFEQALRNRFWRQAKLGEKVHTWKEAVTRFKKEADWAASTRKMNETALELFDPLNPIPVAAIDDEVIVAARARVEKAYSASYTDRCMAVFRSVLNACEEPWKWITKAPNVHVGKPKERDPVWLSAEQCEALVRELPEHTRAPMVFGAITGLRMSNVRDLTWDRIDLDKCLAWVPSSHHKNKQFHTVPLSAEAVTLLKALPKVHRFVFVYRPRIKGGELDSPRPIAGTFNTKAFRKARKRAGLTIRWHDLRYTFASWLALSGASERVIALMGGWLTPAMVKKYARLRTDDVRQWADKVGTNAGAAIAAISLPREEKSLGNQLVPAEGIEPPTPSLRKLRAIRGGK